MGKAARTIGTAIVIAGLAVATGGAALALGAGVNLTGAAALAGSTTLSIGSFSVSAGNLIAAGGLISGLGGAETPGGSRGADKWTSDLDGPLPFAFGRVFNIPGTIVYRKAYGPDDDQYQTIVSVLSRAGPIRSLIKFESARVQTTFDGGTGEVTSGGHVGAMWVQTRLGDQPQTAMTSPSGLEDGATAPGWDSNCTLNGSAAYMLTVYENSKYSEYRNGLEKAAWTFLGKFGWDPRLDSTWPGGSGSCRLNDPTTWVPIEEGCIAALNWAIGMWEGDSGSGTYGVPYQCKLVGGIGSSLDGIDVDSFVYGANIADDNDWVLSAYPNSAMDESIVLAQMLQSSGCRPSHNAGKIRCVSLGAAQASLVTVTARDTAGPVELSLGPSRLNRRNTGFATFWSEDHDGQMTPLDPISNPDWVTIDRDGPRYMRVAYPNVRVADQAAQLIYLDIANTREPYSGVVPFKSHMRRVKDGDCFTFVEPGFKLDGVKARCLKRVTDPMTGIIRVEWREETDAKYAEAMAQEGVAPPATTPSGPPVYPLEPPNSISVVPYGDSVTIQARAPDDSRHDHVNVYRSIDSSDFADASLLLQLPGAPGAYVYADDPITLTGGYRYWFEAANSDDSVVSPVKVGPIGPIPLTGSISALQTGAGDLLRTGAGDYLIPG